jgi:hypothetical protein
MRFLICYQPYPADLGHRGPIVAHAVDKPDANRSVANEPLYGKFTDEKWPGRAPECHWCAEVLRSAYRPFIT